MKKLSIDELFELMAKDGYEQMVFHYDKKTGLKAISSIHNTALGFGIGGTRFWNYDSADEAAIDVMRLAKGMTYKCAGAGLNGGGAKNVIIGDPAKIKTPELMQTYGRFIQTLNGRDRTGQDMNITPEDVGEMVKECDFIAGKPSAGKSTGYFTAIGIYEGLKAAAEFKFGSKDLKGKVIAFQGVGAVGLDTAKYCANDGAIIKFTDINEDNIARIKEAIPTAEFVDPNEILFTDCDILSPNAMGAIFNDETIPKLKCKVIAGAANNVLADAKHGDMLQDAGIAYAPDYIINAAGVIRAFWDTQPNFSEDRVLEDTMKIGPRITEILNIAKNENISAAKAADLFCERRIENEGSDKIWVNKN